jgi:ubiquinone/menaquinone biosynthesis C-methylase UbiE
VKRSYEAEMMDLPDPPEALLVEDLRNLRVINTCLGNHRNVLRGLARLVGKQEKFSLLDVGTGSADVPATIARWARREGLSARLSGLEPNQVTITQAVKQTKEFPEISLVRADGMTLPFRGRSFDFILASQMLHHYSEERIVGFLRSWAQVARQGIIVSDLIRHPLAYYGIRLLTRLFTRNVMTRTDGPLSVRRGLTLAEWRELFQRADVGSCEIHWAFPFRVLALITLRA